MIIGSNTEQDYSFQNILVKINTLRWIACLLSDSKDTFEKPLFGHDTSETDSQLQAPLAKLTSHEPF